MIVYRKSLFLSDMAWNDCISLYKNRRTVSLADQLYRAVGSISANVAEGYSKGTGKIVPDSSSTLSDRPERAGTGTSRQDTL